MWAAFGFRNQIPLLSALSWRCSTVSFHGALGASFSRCMPTVPSVAPNLDLLVDPGQGPGNASVFRFIQVSLERTFVLGLEDGEGFFLR